MKLLKRILLFLAIIITVVLLYLIFNGYILYKDAIDEKSLEDRIAELKEDEHFITYSDVPEYYLDAVVCIEDHRFFSHFGVDIFSTLRALKNNIIAKEFKEGGSSITQQVAKNLYF